MPTTAIAHVNNVSHQMQVDSGIHIPEISASVPRPTSHHLDAYGIPRSQEAAVVTQVFSPYITSSDEQQAQTNGPESLTHARNPSNESASLPQSHDYETVPGILPRQVQQQTSSPAYQPPSGSTTTSEGGRTTPLRIGIAFGTLPNVSSSSEASTSTTASSSGLFTTRTAKTDGKVGGGGASPGASKKNADKSLRFGFGNR